MQINSTGLSSASSIILGCCVAIVSSAIQSLGITLQRKSHLINYHHVLPGETTGNSDEQLDGTPTYQQHQNLHHHKRNMWLCGFFLFIIANILGSLIQITTLPLIILSPLQSIGLIFNSILSCMLLPGENFTQKLGYGTAIISIGAFIIAYNGSTTPVEIPGKDANEKFVIILNKLSRPAFLIWFIGTFITILFLLLINWILTQRINHLKFKLTRRQFKSNIQLINKYQFIKGVNFGFISGTLTAHTFLFAKSLIDTIVEIIMNNSHDLKQLSTNFTPLFLLLTMLSIIGFQLTAFNMGLAQILTSILYPLCFLVYNLINLINDVAYNSLLADKIMSLKQLAWVIIGLFAVLCGVVLISWDGAFGNTSNKEDSYLSEEEFILNLKFPYNRPNYHDDTNTKSLNTRLLAHSLEYLDSGESYSTLHGAPNGPKANDNNDDEHEFNDPTELSQSQPIQRSHKRVLSHEQSQLLLLLDV